jgi:kynurenine formamidase
MQLVDLSTLIEHTDRSPVDHTEIEYQDHAAGAQQIQAMLSVPPSLLRNGEGWAVETIRSLSTHGVTHVDAPYHYNSVIQGKPAQTIDQLPLEWFFSDGVKLDVRYKGDGEAVSVDDVRGALEGMGHTLKPLDIVLVQCGADRFYGQPDYMMHGCGVTAEATRWMYERGVRVMGIDAWGWDRPLHAQAQDALAKREAGVFWEAHQCDLPYSQIERLVNLDKLPNNGFKVACFPLKIKGASAAPARVVAIVQGGTR